MKFPFGNFYASHSSRIQILPTTFRIFTHMDHVHITPTLIIVQIIVHHGENFSIFHTSR
jgi:hypothetical protein